MSLFSKSLLQNVLSKLFFISVAILVVFSQSNSLDVLTDFNTCCSNDLNSLNNCTSYSTVRKILPSYGSVSFTDSFSPDNSSLICTYNGLVISNCDSFNPPAGDETYCSSRTCGNSPCYCAYRSIVQNGMDSIGQSVDYAEISIACIPEEGIHLDKRALVENFVTNSINAMVDFNGTHVQFLFPDGELRVFYLVKDNTFLILNSTEQNFLIDLRNFTSTLSTPVIINVYQSSMNVLSFEVSLGTVSICIRPDCTFCFAMASSEFSCLSIWGKTVLILFLIALCCIVILMLPKVGKSTAKTIVMILLFPLFVIYYMGHYILYFRTSDVGVWFITGFYNVVGKFATNPSRVPLVLLFFVCLSSVDACDQTYPLTTLTSNCVLSSPGFNTCNATNMYTTVNYARVGSEICLQVIPSNTNGATLSIYSVKVNGINGYSQGRSLYSTSGFNKHSSSVFRCYTAGDTCSTDTCAAYDSSINRTALIENRLGDPIIEDYPGILSCLPGGSGIFYGCVFNTPGCLFTGISLVPTGKIYEVWDITDIQYKINVTICQTANTVKRCVTQEITDQPYTYQDASISLLNLGAPILQVIPDIFHLVYSNTSAFVGQASAGNIPRAGNVGDIQAINSGNLTAGNFVFDTGIIETVTNNLNSVAYTTSASGIGSLDNSDLFKQLPFIYNGLVVSNNGRQVIIKNVNRPVVLALSIEGASYTVPIISNSCAFCTYLNNSGYVGTGIAANFYMSCYATGNPGFVTLTANTPTETLLDKGFYLNSTSSLAPQAVRVNFQTSRKTGSAQIVYSSTAGSPCLTKDFTFQLGLADQNFNLTNQNGLIDVSLSTGYDSTPSLIQGVLDSKDNTSIWIALASLIVVALFVVVGGLGIAGTIAASVFAFFMYYMSKGGSSNVHIDLSKPSTSKSSFSKNTVQSLRRRRN